jgi:hypothetical protein
MPADTARVKRDLVRLRAVAEAVTGDLSRSLPGDWSVTIDDDYVCIVAQGTRTESVALDEQVDEDAWPEEAWSPRWAQHTLDDDAAEAVMEEVLQVMRLWDMPWPLCPSHGTQATSCSGVWVCSSRSAHDLALVGTLNL